jgi:hypothetical protein
MYKAKKRTLRFVFDEFGGRNEIASANAGSQFSSAFWWLSRVSRISHGATPRGLHPPKAPERACTRGTAFAECRLRPCRHEAGDLGDTSSAPPRSTGNASAADVATATAH